MSARKVKERWTVDFWFEHASGKRERVRKAAPVNTRRGAEEFERQLRVEMLSPTAAEKVIHFADYADEFESVFVKANRARRAVADAARGEGLGLSHGGAGHSAPESSGAEVSVPER